MTDDPKIEYLLVIHELKIKTDVILDSLERLMNARNETLVEVVTYNPEIITQAFQMLKLIVESQQLVISGIVEDRMQMHDDIEQIVTTFNLK